jgi:hypothetical protein
MAHPDSTSLSDLSELSPKLQDFYPDVIDDQMNPGIIRLREQKHPGFIRKEGG